MSLRKDIDLALLFLIAHQNREHQGKAHFSQHGQEGDHPFHDSGPLLRHDWNGQLPDEVHAHVVKARSYWDEPDTTPVYARDSAWKARMDDRVAGAVGSLMAASALVPTEEPSDATHE
jgi:hypothetical protein